MAFDTGLMPPEMQLPCQTLVACLVACPESPTLRKPQRPLLLRVRWGCGGEAVERGLPRSPPPPPNDKRAGVRGAVARSGGLSQRGREGGVEAKHLWDVGRIWTWPRAEWDPPIPLHPPPPPPWDTRGGIPVHRRPPPQANHRGNGQGPCAGGCPGLCPVLCGAPFCPGGPWPFRVGPI